MKSWLEELQQYIDDLIITLNYKLDYLCDQQGKKLIFDTPLTMPAVTKKAAETDERRLNALGKWTRQNDPARVFQSFQLALTKSPEEATLFDSKIEIYPQS